MVGDIPNYDQRRRFVTSVAGRRYHSENFPDHSYAGEVNRITPSNGITDADVLKWVDFLESNGRIAAVSVHGRPLPFCGRRMDLVFR